MKGTFFERKDVRELIWLSVISYAVNSAWEVYHAQLYEVEYGMLKFTITALAALGDVGLTLIVYAAVLMFMGEKKQLGKLTAQDLFMFALFGIVATVFIETLFLQLGWWLYAPSMPHIPYTNLGISPVLQMAITIPFSVWLARRVKN